MEKIVIALFMAVMLAFSSVADAKTQTYQDWKDVVVETVNKTVEKITEQNAASKKK